MEKISGNKILSYPERIFNLDNQRPITADIFLTNYCNNHCDFCTYKRWDLPLNTKYMSFEEFKEIYKRLKELGVKGIVLTGGGEPTLNPDFDKIIKFLEENNIPYGINTNFNIYKEISPSFLKISLDGWNEQSYEEVRGVKKYNTVVSNIKNYLEWKNKNSIDTSVGIQMIGTSCFEIDQFYNANKDLGVDYISIRPMESTSGQYYREHNEKRVVEHLKELQKEDPRILINYKWGCVRTKFNNCTANWSQIAVNENGDVMYCCHKPYEIVGSIFDKDILNKKAEFQTDLSLCDIPCRLSAPNIEIIEYKNQFKNKGVFL